MSKVPRDFLVALWSIDGIGRARYKAILIGLKKAKIGWEEWWHQPAKFQSRLHIPESVLGEITLFKQTYTYQSYGQFLAELKIKTLLDTDPAYPPQLKFLDDHPTVLFYKGDISLVSQPCVAVVGTRKITTYGTYVTKKIVSELVQANVTIVSGFMYGVDAAAHRTASEKKGHTAGVLGFGFQHFYPSSFQGWMTELLQQNQVFMTEYAPHVRPTTGTFPARNRLIAGLSLGVIVTEAAQKSGSHITADWANEYGRSVYAVPGPITNPYAEGTRSLMNQGALCVNSGQEVLADLGIVADSVSTNVKSATNLSSLGRRIYGQLEVSPQSLNQLITASHQSSATLLAELGLLEVLGLITRDRNQWRRLP